MERRDFLGSLLAFFSATALFSFLYPLVRFLAPHVRKTDIKKIAIAKKGIPEGESKIFVFDNTPALVINRHEKGFIALTKVCTHLGCLLEHDRGRKELVCPCHAGVYDLDGNVVSGPPPRPLTRLPLTVDGENIIIG